MRATLDAYLGYYESRPEYYRLIFMTEQAYVESSESRWTEAPIYREVAQTSQALTRPSKLATTLNAYAWPATCAWP